MSERRRVEIPVGNILRPPFREGTIKRIPFGKLIREAQNRIVTFHPSVPNEAEK